MQFTSSNTIIDLVSTCADIYQCQKLCWECDLNWSGGCQDWSGGCWVWGILVGLGVEVGGFVVGRLSIGRVGRSEG